MPFAHFPQLGNNLFRASPTSARNHGRDAFACRRLWRPALWLPPSYYHGHGLCSLRAELFSRNSFRTRLRISLELLDGSSWSVEAWDPVSAMGGAGPLWLRRGA